MVAPPFQGPGLQTPGPLPQAHIPPAPTDAGTPWTQLLGGSVVEGLWSER